MQINEYAAFVDATDLNRDKEIATREDIAIYGVVGEMGAVTSAVKRRMIAEETGTPWNLASEEVVEELGDALWYWAVLCEIHRSGPSNVLKECIERVSKQLQADDASGELFRNSVGEERTAQFAKRSTDFLTSADFPLDEFRDLAYLTRRTDGKTLVGVCLSVLAQLGAELLKQKFPEVEQEINTVISNRKTSTILAEIAWHLAAVASIYGLTLTDVADYNREKINKRLDKTKRTRSHDERYPSHEHFPRRFQIGFVRISNSRSRMYLNGNRLGADLTDNSYVDDGYRFHDVLHLGVLAHLGWSPVLRSLMKRKRKSNPKTDEVEDGARATIVEEAVIKAIHSEGERVSAPRRTMAGGATVPLFAFHNEISFQFLRFIETLTKGLEVEKNQYWEWEKAMLQSSEVFFQLCSEGQGTVTVDLDEPSISFQPDVYVDVAGPVVGAGTAIIKKAALPNPEIEASKKAILSALSLEASEENLKSLSVALCDAGVSVKVTGPVQEAMWDRKIVSFKVSNATHEDLLHCTVLGIADPTDHARKMS